MYTHVIRRVYSWARARTLKHRSIGVLEEMYVHKRMVVLAQAPYYGNSRSRRYFGGSGTTGACASSRMNKSWRVTYASAWVTFHERKSSVPCRKAPLQVSMMKLLMFGVGPMEVSRRCCHRHSGCALAHVGGAYMWGNRTCHAFNHCSELKQ